MSRNRREILAALGGVALGGSSVLAAQDNGGGPPYTGPVADEPTAEESITRFFQGDYHESVLPWSSNDIVAKHYNDRVPEAERWNNRDLRKSLFEDPSLAAVTFVTPRFVMDLMDNNRGLSVHRINQPIDGEKIQRLMGTAATSVEVYNNVNPLGLKDRPKMFLDALRQSVDDIFKCYETWHKPVMLPVCPEVYVKQEAYLLEWFVWMPVLYVNPDDAFRARVMEMVSRRRADRSGKVSAI